jgi:hypothetical protein
MPLEAARASISLRPLAVTDHAAALERLLARSPGLCWAAQHDCRWVAPTASSQHDAECPQRLL